jgi:hypothetical protein
MRLELGWPPNAQVHDSLLSSVPPSRVWELAKLLTESLERPRMYGGEWLSVPCEYTLGTTWEGSIEFKRLPSQKEMTEAAWSLVEK